MIFTQWRLSPNLRWKKGHGPSSRKPILQQQWHSDQGDIEWHDIQEEGHEGETIHKVGHRTEVNE